MATAAAEKARPFDGTRDSPFAEEAAAESAEALKEQSAAAGEAALSALKAEHTEAMKGQLQAANPALRQAPLRPAPRQRNPPPTPQDLEDFGELDPKLRAVLRSFGTPAG